MINRSRAITKLKKVQDNHDTEVAHSDADKVLCALLSSLGYEDVVVEYRKVSKWFA